MYLLGAVLIDSFEGRVLIDAGVKGNQLVTMTPAADSPVNNGHSCVKGRFASAYVNHKERLMTPMIRESINDEFKGSGQALRLAFGSWALGAYRRSATRFWRPWQPRRPNEANTRLY